MTFANQDKADSARTGNGRGRPRLPEGPPRPTWHVHAVEWLAAVVLVGLVAVLRLATLSWPGGAWLLVGALVVLLPLVPALAIRGMRQALRSEEEIRAAFDSHEEGRRSRRPAGEEGGSFSDVPGAAPSRRGPPP